MSARLLFGLFLGISSIAMPALAIAAGGDLGGASIHGRDVWTGGGSVGSGESDSSSLSIGGHATLDPMALQQTRAQAPTGSAQMRPPVRWEAFRVAKNDGSGKGGKSGSQGRSGSDGKGKSGDKGNSGKGGPASGSQGKGKSGTSGALGGASVTPSGTAQGGPHMASLPLILRPLRQGSEATPRTPGVLLRREQQFAMRPGTPGVIVRTCRQAIAATAVPLGAVRVSAASAGRLGRAGGALVAPISVSIEYLRQGGIERREARVNCLLSEEGAVVALR
jgi:hypothetical protein